MRKQISVVFALLLLSVAVVSAHPSKQVKENDSGQTVVLKAADCAAIDALFINDAVVPVVQSNLLNHMESVLFIPEGYKPETAARARAPTTERKNFIPFSRDKTVA